MGPLQCCCLGPFLVIFIDLNDRHKVQLKQGQVRQVVSTERLPCNMGVNEPDTPEPTSPRPLPAQIREKELVRIADDHVFDAAATIDQNTHLSADVRGDLGHKLGQLSGNQGFRGDAPAKDAFEGLLLLGFESVEVAVEVVSYDSAPG